MSSFFFLTTKFGFWATLWRIFLAGAPSSSSTTESHSVALFGLRFVVHTKLALNLGASWARGLQVRIPSPNSRWPLQGKSNIWSCIAVNVCWQGVSVVSPFFFCKNWESTVLKRSRWPWSQMAPIRSGEAGWGGRFPSACLALRRLLPSRASSCC